DDSRVRGGRPCGGHTPVATAGSVPPGTRQGTGAAFPCGETHTAASERRHTLAPPSGTARNQHLLGEEHLDGPRDVLLHGRELGVVRAGQGLGGLGGGLALAQQLEEARGGLVQLVHLVGGEVHDARRVAQLPDHYVLGQRVAARFGVVTHATRLLQGRAATATAGGRRERRRSLAPRPGAGPHATVIESSRYTSWMRFRSFTPSAIGRWNALRPEIRPMPPPRLFSTAVSTASA